jgi:hypothetical protein
MCFSLDYLAIAPGNAQGLIEKLGGQASLLKKSSVTRRAAMIVTRF